MKTLVDYINDNPTIQNAYIEVFIKHGFDELKFITPCKRITLDLVISIQSSISFSNFKSIVEKIPFRALSLESDMYIKHDNGPIKPTYSSMIIKDFDIKDLNANPEK